MNWRRGDSGSAHSPELPLVSGLTRSQSKTAAFNGVSVGEMNYTAKTEFDSDTPSQRAGG